MLGSGRATYRRADASTRPSRPTERCARSWSSLGASLGRGASGRAARAATAGRPSARCRGRRAPGARADLRAHRAGGAHAGRAGDEPAVAPRPGAVVLGARRLRAARRRRPRSGCACSRRCSPTWPASSASSAPARCPPQIAVSARRCLLQPHAVGSMDRALRDRRRPHRDGRVAGGAGPGRLAGRAGLRAAEPIGHGPGDARRRAAIGRRADRIVRSRRCGAASLRSRPPGGAARAPSCSAAGRRTRPTSSTRTWRRRWGSTWPRAATWSCARTGCGCARSTASSRSTSSTAAIEDERARSAGRSAAPVRRACPASRGRRRRAAWRWRTPSARTCSSRRRSPPCCPRCRSRCSASRCSCAQLDPTEQLGQRRPCTPGRRDRLAVARPGGVRLQLVASPDGITVMRGGVGRVLAADDDPTRPTRNAGQGRVGGRWPAGHRCRRGSRHHPQVDFGSSVPKRAAEALFWMGRAAERAEVTARTIRVIGGQVQQDPSLVGLGIGAWSQGALSMLRAAQSRAGRRSTSDQLGALPLVDRLHHELVAAQTTVAAQIAALVQAATSVREYLSTTTGRVLGRLTRIRADLLGADAAADDLDIVLVDLAALAGLSLESTVRGPAWRFLDLGRRLERALTLCGSLEAGIGIAADALSFQPLAESVLSTNESLVAYRRRYRSDVELTAVVDLLVHDDANPRSLAFQLDRLREHMASLAWREGGDLVQRAEPGRADTDRRRGGGRSPPVGRCAGAGRARAIARTGDGRLVAVVRRSGQPDGDGCAMTATDVASHGPDRSLLDRSSHRVQLRLADVRRLHRRPSACRATRRTSGSSRPPSTSSRTADEFEEHLDPFGNRVVRLGMHHAHDQLSVVRHAAWCRSTSSHPTTRASAGGVTWDDDRRCGAASPRRSRRRGGAVRRRHRCDAGAGRSSISSSTTSSSPGRPLIDVVRGLSSRIHHEFQFDSEFSDVSTPIAAVLEARRGVCQDFAHLALACLRSRRSGRSIRQRLHRDRCRRRASPS